MFGVKNIVYGLKNIPQKLASGGMRACFCPAKPKVKPYKLLEKTELPAEQFPKDSWSVPEGAASFKRVIIGKSADSDYRHEIVTFYNKNRQMIKQYQKGSNIPDTVKDYEYSHGVSIDEKPVRVKNIHTKKYLPVHEGTDFCRWTPVSDESQYVRNLPVLRTTKGNKHPKKLHITKTTHEAYNPVSTVNLTEYPANYGIEPKSAKKEMKLTLRFDYEKDYYMPAVTDISSSSNIKVPENDKFLPFRFLKGQEKQETLARYFIKEKGLEDTGISVGTSKSMVSDDACACFKPEKGEIWFKYVDKEPVDTAAHEAEHAWQHAIFGRAFATTDYEKRCRNLFGPLKTMEEHSEAQKIAQARAKYQSCTRDEYGKINKEYFDNYLEVKAREAGEKAQNEYNKGRNFILKQFRYIPKTDC